MPINPCRNPKCEYFNRTLPINARHCPGCGQPLGNAVDIAIPDAYRVHKSLDPISPLLIQSNSHPTLKLVHPDGQEFYLKSEMGYIGRSSPTSVIMPEIDLKGIPNDGVISRGAHARLYWDGNQKCYIIVDNSSRNGTYLDGTLLQPDTPYRLKSGALLQLGQDGLVRLRVMIG
ncbi:MAG: FHA domain-containing protein [Cyanobacteria bacterium RM1_2_2]|nr:FHA domain-containing protein [Cyanobacteria bacterium RM1_2_2]